MLRLCNAQFRCHEFSLTCAGNDDHSAPHRCQCLLTFDLDSWYAGKQERTLIYHHTVTELDSHKTVTFIAAAASPILAATSTFDT